MLIAQIYQTYIPNESIESKIIESIDTCKVILTEKELIVYYKNGNINHYKLNYFNEDFVTKTYLCSFENGTQFRVIVPNETALINICKEFNCISAFSIGSINPDDYAIHLILNENIKEINIKRYDLSKQIQKLIEGSIMSHQFSLSKQFLEYTKRLLTLINNINELNNFKNGTQLIKLINNNLDLYTVQEKSKINPDQ